MMIVTVSVNNKNIGGLYVQNLQHEEQGITAYAAAMLKVDEDKQSGWDVEGEPKVIGHKREEGAWVLVQRAIQAFQISEQDVEVE